MRSRGGLGSPARVYLCESPTFEKNGGKKMRASNDCIPVLIISKCGQRHAPKPNRPLLCPGLVAAAGTGLAVLSVIEAGALEQWRRLSLEGATVKVLELFG